MDKTDLNDTDLGGTTSTAQKSEVSTCRKIYYYKENWVMVNQSVNECYTRLLLKIDALPQDVAFPLYIAANFFNNLGPGISEFLISEGVQAPKIPITETNHQVKKEAPFGQKHGSGIRK